MLDVAPPLLVDLEPGSDSGTYNDDNLTNVRTSIVDITAARDSDTIRLYGAGVLLGQATHVAGTAYQYTFIAGQLAEGGNSITARAFDGTNESADSPALVITLDTLGPRITASTPDAPVNLRTTTFDSLTVTYNEVIDFNPAGGGSFWLDDVAISGPQGAIAPTGITSLGSDQYRVAFAAQTQRGIYRAAIGPDVSDLAGNLMDQDQDGTPGEAGQDVFKLDISALSADTIFTTATTIAEGDTAYDGQDIAINHCTVTINGPHSFHSVQLANGAVLTHSANTATQTHKLDLTVTDQVIVDATSKIDVTGKGYAYGHTSGNTTVGASTGYSGGSYGGMGGKYDPYPVNAVYGDYADPNDWGSGGGASSGGGLVRITAGTLTLDGMLLADAGTVNAGAGSGGGISVDAGVLNGSGLIRASGGAANYGWGPGGGGRVAVYAQDYSGFELAKIAAPGGGTGAGVGSVYLRDTDDTYGKLIFDAGTVTGGSTPLGVPGVDTLTVPDEVTIRGANTHVYAEHAGLVVTYQQALTISQGASLSSAGESFVPQGTLLVTGGGSLA